MAEQTATNKQTGERVVLRNGQWVPMEAPLSGIPASTGGRPSSAIVSDNITRTFLNNAMALPSASGDLLSSAAGFAQTVAETPFSEGGFGDRLKSNTQSQQGQFPANVLRSIPRPTVTDITSGFKALPALVPGGESFSDAFDREKSSTQQALALEAEERPYATGAGVIGGDILSLAAGRQPFAKGLVENSSKLPDVTNRVTRDALEAIARAQPDLVPRIAEIIGSSRLSAPGTERLFRRVLDSGPMRSVLRGLGKGAEASLEGAVMAAVKENDPIVNAGLAGGSQLALSMTGTVLGVPKSLKDLAIKAGGLFALFRVGQEFMPGENNTYTATDSAFNKMAMALTLGVSSQVLGGRFRGSDVAGRRFAEDLPRISDAINSIPRGALNSLLNQVQREQENGDTLTLTTLEMLSNNAEAFPEGIRNRLLRSLNNNSFPDEVQRLRNKEVFTNILNRASTTENRN